MTAKREFDAEEWTALQEAPALAALRVSAASRGGNLKETVALARSYAEARKHDAGLTSEIVAAPPPVDAGRFGGDREALAVRARQVLRRAVDILEAKATPEEVEDYRLFVVWVATEVARAHKEGGFLGIGGEEISADEEEALAEIRRHLGLDGRT